MELIFVRHGESEANARHLIQGQSDFPLSQAGRLQAERTAQALVSFPVEIIFTSPLRRAQQTAEIITRGRKAEVKILPDLREYYLGAFEGLSQEEVLERFPHVRPGLAEGIPFHHLAPGAESDLEVDQRACRALECILAAGHEHIVVVSHLGLLERLLRQIVQRYDLKDKIQPDWIPLSNCSLSHLRFTPAGVSLLSLNDTAHLASD